MPLRILDTDKVISLDDKYIVWLKYSTECLSISSRRYTSVEY